MVGSHFNSCKLCGIPIPVMPTGNLYRYEATEWRCDKGVVCMEEAINTLWLIELNLQQYTLGNWFTAIITSLIVTIWYRLPLTIWYVEHLRTHIHITCFEKYVLLEPTYQQNEVQVAGDSEHLSWSCMHGHMKRQTEVAELKYRVQYTASHGQVEEVWRWFSQQLYRHPQGGIEWVLPGCYYKCGHSKQAGTKP